MVGRREAVVMILLTAFFGCQTNPGSAGFSFEGVGRCSCPCRTWSQRGFPILGCSHCCVFLNSPVLMQPLAPHLPDGGRAGSFSGGSVLDCSGSHFWGAHPELTPPALFQQFCKHLVRCIKSVLPVPCTDKTDEQNTINNSVPRNLKT